MDKVYLGEQLVSMSPGVEALPISRVELLDDEGDVVGVAGDESGRTITATNPDGTNEMASSILAAVVGYQYRPFEGDGAVLDPAAELGDGITVAGTYSVLAMSTTRFDQLHSVSISAPTTDEVDDEFPYVSREQRAINRKIAKTRSLITKTADKILLKVEDELNGLSASIDVQLGSITNQVNGLGDAVSTVSQTANKINWLVASGTSASDFTMTDRAASLVADKIDMTGFVTFSSLSVDGESTIHGGNITTGKIATDHLHLGGEMYIYSGSSTDITNYGGSFGYYQGWMYDANGNLQTTNGVGIRYSSTRGQLNCTSGGVWCGYGSRAGLSAYSTGVTIKGSTIQFDGAVDFSASSVSGLDSLDGSYVSVKGKNDVTLSLADGTIAVKLDKNNGRIKFWVDGTAWYLDSDGLHQ